MMSLDRLPLYWRTVRHLKWRQSAGRLRLRLRQTLENPAAFRGRASPPFPGDRWRSRGAFTPPIPPPPAPADFQAGRLVFLNRACDTGWPPDWGFPGPSRLWRYHLHYFDYIWFLEFDPARAVVLDWIERHPLDRGRVGWEPYPLSLRIVNWCGFFFGRHGGRTASDDEFREALWRSLHLQARWLMRHREIHLLGNHLLENGAALAVIGSCFDGEASDRWRRAGIGILSREVPEQILPDGMHFERSPMYHARVVWVLLFLFNTGDAALRRVVEKPLGKALDALRRLLHPDGRIALLNDSALGGTVEPSVLLRAADRLPGCTAAASTGPWALPAAGYFGYRGERGTYIVCDAGPVGPDYIPGHAHGDIFHFELSVEGHRVIVDSGVHDYEESEMRRYCRSTAAHNTVEIEGQDQCEFWAAFRVARRGRPRDVLWEPGSRGFRLEGWHDGYQRLAGAPRHSRAFHWSAPATLEVTDEIRAARPVRAVTRLHLHPACRVETLEGNRAVVGHPGGRIGLRFHGPGRLDSAPSWYCPEFGIRTANIALTFTFSGSSVNTGFRIEPE